MNETIRRPCHGPRYVCRAVAFACAVFGGAFVTPVAASGAATTFKCSPRQLSRHDLLSLNLGFPHPAELAVVRPDGAYFFIAQRRWGDSPRATGMPTELLAGMTEIRLVPEHFQARQWHAKAIAEEPVFDRPGRYRFLLSDRLATDDGTPVQTCEVQLLD